MSDRGIEGGVEERIQDHLDSAEMDDPKVDTQRPRIILASAGFSKELTTTVLWLRDSGIDISCVKLKLYRNGDGLILDTSQIIPLPEATEYLVKVREKAEEVIRRRSTEERISPGGMEFLESIEGAQENAKPMLRKVYEWAVAMEEEGLASLRTFKGGNNTNLQVELPHSDSSPVTIRNEPPKETMRLRPRHFDRYAPGSRARIEEIIGREFKQSTTPIFLSSLSEGPRVGLLDALTEAYR